MPVEADVMMEFKQFFLALILLLLIVASLSYGPAPLNHLVLELRVVRTLASLFIGMSLAVAGALLQISLRNPLASPFTLGVTQAASFGAAFAIVFLGAGETATGYPVVTAPYLVTGMAFLSSLAALALVYWLSSVKAMHPYAIVLAGISVGFMFQALTMLTQYLAPHEVLVSMTLFWMFGDTSRLAIQELVVVSMAAAAVTVFGRRFWLPLTTLLLGDDAARSSGVDPSSLRRLVLVVSALAVAVSTAFTGVIGFIGLIAPHIARLLGGLSVRKLIPLTAVVGATLLLASDLAGRILLYPASLPVGITTSIIGVPALIFLMMRWKQWRHIY